MGARAIEVSEPLGLVCEGIVRRPGGSGSHRWDLSYLRGPAAGCRECVEVRNGVCDAPHPEDDFVVVVSGTQSITGTIITGTSAQSSHITPRRCANVLCTCALCTHTRCA